MTSRDFCYWLQGFFELDSAGAGMTASQAGIVRQHLALVFVHEIDPSAGGPAEPHDMKQVPTLIRWEQYTPYFNDGDTCTFGIHPSPSTPGITYRC